MNKATGVFKIAIIKFTYTGRESETSLRHLVRLFLHQFVRRSSSGSGRLE